MRWLCMLSGLALIACSDPLRDSRIEVLGEEDAAFPPSEIHRPGQPCVLCHSEYQGDEPLLSIAGTLFKEPLEGEPLQMVPDHTIRIIDSDGKIKDIPTNRCGNFFLKKEEFDPAFPLRAELFGPGPDGIIPIDVMASRIGRDGSCGFCHAHPASSLSPGVVFVPAMRLSPTVDLPEEGTCPPPRFAPNLFDPSTQQ